MLLLILLLLLVSLFDVSVCVCVPRCCVSLLCSTNTSTNTSTSTSTSININTSTSTSTRTRTSINTTTSTSTSTLRPPLTVIAPPSDPYASKRSVAGERRGGLVRHAAEHSVGDAADENGLKPPTQPAGGLLMVPRPKPPAAPTQDTCSPTCRLARDKPP